MGKRALLVSVLLGLSAAAAPAQKDGADGLKAIFAALASAVEKKDWKAGRDLTTSILPDKAALAKVLRPDVPAATVEKLLAPYQTPLPDETAARLLVPGDNRTEIKVQAATTEELAAYKPGSAAYQSFPGGAKRLAETILKPGKTFYEVEVTEPGKGGGMKYHMFFWDGARWRMLGPAWRTVK